ncbi:hypothetical protein ACLX1H_007070 [Fusarium chlamydosporum]
MGALKSSNSSSHRRNLPCAFRGCRKGIAYFSSSGTDSIYCENHSCFAGPHCKNPTDRKEKFCDYHAVCRQVRCGKRISQEDESFKYSTTGTMEWFCPDLQTVARQKAVTAILATPTLDTAKIMPKRTNARYQTVLQIELQNTTATNTLANILTVIGDLLLLVGIDESASTINLFASIIRAARWDDATVSSRQVLRFVLNMNVISKPAIEVKTSTGPLPQNIATSIDALSRAVHILSWIQVVIMSRYAPDIPVDYQVVARWHVLTGPNPLTVGIIVAPTPIASKKPKSPRATA